MQPVIDHSDKLEPAKAMRKRGGPVTAAILSLVLFIGAISLLFLLKDETRTKHDRTNFVEMEVLNVVKDTTDGGATLVLQDMTADTFLAIGIGENEATAIEYELYHRTPPRPLTPDLLKNLMETTDMRLTEAEISHVADHTYFAKLYIANGRELLEMDARPSDAIALALRFECPIFVHRAVLEQYGIKGREHRRRRDRARKLISEVRPAENENILHLGEHGGIV